MGPFYHKKSEFEGQLAIEAIDENGQVTAGFVKDKAEINEDSENHESYVILGRMVRGFIVDEDGKSRPVEEVFPSMAWED